MVGRSHSLGARLVSLVIAAIPLCACDIDLFGFDQRRLAGPFWLHVWEGGNFTLEVAKEPEDGGCGVLGGRVRRIGWTEAVILAEQETCGGTGARSGWVVVTVKTKAIEPVEASAIAARPELASIKVLEADEAWKRLK